MTIIPVMISVNFKSIKSREEFVCFNGKNLFFRNVADIQKREPALSERETRYSPKDKPDRKRATSPLHVREKVTFAYIISSLLPSI